MADNSDWPVPAVSSIYCRFSKGGLGSVLS